MVLNCDLSLSFLPFSHENLQSKNEEKTDMANASNEHTTHICTECINCNLCMKANNNNKINSSLLIPLSIYNIVVYSQFVYFPCALDAHCMQ